MKQLFAWQQLLGAVVLFLGTIHTDLNYTACGGILYLSGVLNYHWEGK